MCFESSSTNKLAPILTGRGIFLYVDGFNDYINRQLGLPSSEGVLEYLPLKGNQAYTQLLGFGCHHFPVFGQMLGIDVSIRASTCQ